jgi:acetyl esterase/lipase
MTESFNKLGFAVFKFDFFGLGDSEGEIDRELMAEVYFDTQSGIFVDDGADALNWLQENRGADSFILGGLCGGAITGILLAKDEMRVQGLLSLGMTTTLELGATDRRKYATQGELAALRKGYMRRLFQPKSWLRLLTLRSDFKTIKRSVGQLFTQKKAAPAPVSDEAQTGLIESDANPQFPPAFFKMAKEDRKILLIFSERDRLFWEFEEKFAQPYADRLAEVNSAYSLHVVKSANHVFTFREWESEMLQTAENWLEANFLGTEPKTSG